VNNQRITESKDICDCFNNYFCTVGEKLSSNIVQPDINFNKYLPPASKESMFCAPTTRRERDFMITCLLIMYYMIINLVLGSIIPPLWLLMM